MGGGDREYTTAASESKTGDCLRKGTTRALLDKAVIHEVTNVSLTCKEPTKKVREGGIHIHTTLKHLSGMSGIEAKYVLHQGLGNETNVAREDGHRHTSTWKCQD